MLKTGSLRKQKVKAKLARYFDQRRILYGKELVFSIEKAVYLIKEWYHSMKNRFKLENNPFPENKRFFQRKMGFLPNGGVNGH